MKGPLRWLPSLSLPDADFSRRVEMLGVTTAAVPGSTRWRFRGDVHVLSAPRWQEIQRACERLMAAIDEAIEWLRAHPVELQEFFEMPPSWLAMCVGGAQWWHAFARMDVFITSDDRVLVCEVNADTPSGQTDMWALEGVLGKEPDGYELPGHAYSARFFSLVGRLATRALDEGESPVLGLVYPTDIPEDLDLIQAYERLARGHGFRVIVGAPEDLEIGERGEVRLFGHRLDVMLRHYKTDWWGDRRRSRYDAPQIPDALPLDVLAPVLEAERTGRLCVLNPFGAMLAQSKKLFAFLWERLDVLSDEAQATVRAHVPRTYRLTSRSVQELGDARARWVLKGEFGCEGDEVVVGALTEDESWRLALELAIPERWVVQEFFEVAPLGDGALPNLGVYLVGGECSGLYVRVNDPHEITDERARVLPVVIERGSRGA